MKNYQFYHSYPLGMLNQLEENNQETRSLSDIKGLIPHMKSMNINALYLGPVFESIYHGYDTVDYYQVDRRLGCNEELAQLVQNCHEEGIDVILDCVFNHVSRDFFAFKDCLIYKEESKYRNWFNINFYENNQRNDGFNYETWDGHDELVKLNLSHPKVQEYLQDVAKYWIEYFHIDGLRLDAADVMDQNFTRALVESCRAVKHDFYIFGEIVHGDYRDILNNTGMDSITNYECYKGMYSSLNDANYYEIAYSFKRLFGEEGSLKGKAIYNFVDNHDVNRVASTLKNERHLYPLYLMLYTMNGYPSIYYGSEFGLKGERTNFSDIQLRPSFYLEDFDLNHPLYQSIQKISGVRKDFPLLAYGGYEEVMVEDKLIGYRRYDHDKSMLIFINSDENPYNLDGPKIKKLLNDYNLEGYDLLNQEHISNDLINKQLVIHPYWGRIII